MTSVAMDKLRVKSHLGQECLAEILGTFVLILFGGAANAQSLLSKHEGGNILSVNIAWGLAITFGVLTAGGISGAHLNPAVSVAQAVVLKFQWKKVPFYILSQFAGSFLASVVVYFLYYDAINNYAGDARNLDTAGIWATYPQDFLSIWGGFFDQVVGTGALLLGINAITDENNMRIPQHLIPISVGLLVIAIGMCFGFNCGYAINPARDLAPRIFTCVAGWGVQPFSVNNYTYFWIPIVGPLAGGVIGAATYKLFIELHRSHEMLISDKDNSTTVDA